MSKILLSGYLLSEGRFSMVRTAHSLYKHLPPLLNRGDEVALDEAEDARQAAVLRTSGLSLKVEKRLKTPLRLKRSAWDCLHLVDSDYCFGLSKKQLSKTVVTCHDMMPFLVYDSLEQAFPKALGRYFFQRVLKNLPHCGRIVTVSEFSKQSILRFTQCREEQIEVILQGVEEHFRPIETWPGKAMDFLREKRLVDKRLILHVGATERYKNMSTLFQVIASLQKELAEPVYLLKVGGSFDEAQKQEIADLGIPNRIIHLTGLAEEELVWVYNHADLLLFPSHFEGFGWPALEAMACGTPVVASTGGSLPEVTGEAIPSHAPKDSSAFTSSCLRILQDASYREQIKEQGLEQAARFSWQGVAQQYYEVYQSLC